MAPPRRGRSICTRRAVTCACAVVMMAMTVTPVAADFGNGVTQAASIELVPDAVANTGLTCANGTAFKYHYMAIVVSGTDASLSDRPGFYDPVRNVIYKDSFVISRELETGRLLATVTSSGQSCLYDIILKGGMLLGVASTSPATEAAIFTFGDLDTNWTTGTHCNKNYPDYNYAWVTYYDYTYPDFEGRHRATFLGMDGIWFPGKNVAQLTANWGTDPHLWVSLQTKDNTVRYSTHVEPWQPSPNHQGPGPWGCVYPMDPIAGSIFGKAAPRNDTKIADDSANTTTTNTNATTATPTTTPSTDTPVSTPTTTTTTISSTTTTPIATTTTSTTTTTESPLTAPVIPTHERRHLRSP